MTGTTDQSNRLLAESLTRREREILALLAEGLTGPEIAGRLTLATSSVKSHIQHLYSKLGVNSKREAVSRAQALGLLRPTATGPSAVSAPAAGAKAIHNLPPQLTRFFGREDDIARVQERLAEWRLVTLTGPGGVGKTRLSLRVAEESLPYYPDGIWFVELAPISDPTAVDRHIVRTLGEYERPNQTSFQAIKAQFGEKRILLVLDHCEHLLDACAWFADALLRACLRLRILATSREPLGVSGEANYLVPSLPFPEPKRVRSIEELAQYTAVSLFVDRARAVVPDYVVTPRNARYLARICERLDGIPLALELAAARVNLLTSEQLAGRLDDVFAVLTGGSRTALPRHQTLRATIDWSYNLLGEGERLLLQRLSAFAGGCTLEAAESVCAGEGLPAVQVLEQLATLVQKSMVVATRRSEEEPRYHLLEMVRQYAGERLAAAGDQQRLSRRHWEYFLRLAETNRRPLLSKEWPTLFRKFHVELENLRSALAWAFEQTADHEAGVRLVIGLQPVWFAWDHRETHKWAARGIEQIQRGARIAPGLQARFLAWASVAAWCGRGARTIAEQSLTIARTLGPDEAETLCWSLWVLAVGLDDCYMEIQADHWQQAEALLDEQEALIQATGPHASLDPRLYLAYNRWLRAVLANYRGQFELAEVYGQESLQLVKDDFHSMHAISPLIALGDTALRTGDNDQALAYIEEAYRTVVLAPDYSYIDVRQSDLQVLMCEVHLRRGDLALAYEYCRQYIQHGGQPYTIERMEMAARIFARAGRYPEAARLSAAAEAASERFGRPTSSRTVAEYYWGDWRYRYADVSLEALVPGWPNHPDAAAIQQAWDEGRSMTYEQARSYALNDVVI